MSFLPPVVMEIYANATQATTSMRAVNGELATMQVQANAAGASMTRLEKAAVISSAAFKAVGLATAAIGVLSIKAAMEQEVAFSRMNEAMKTAKDYTSATSEEFIKATDAAINLGFADEVAAGALGTLVTATGSAKEAQLLLGSAMDLARYKHIDLNTAATIMARATQGSAKAFKELGITLDTSLPKQEAINKAFDQLNEKIGGQSQAYLDTFAGKMSVLAAKTDQLAEKFGDILIPIVSKLIDFITKYGTQLAIAAGAIVSFIVVTKVLITVMNIFKAAQIIYIALTVGQTAAQTALTFATSGGAAVTKSMAAAQFLLNAAMRANPIGLVITGVALLIGALVVLWNHSDKVRNAMVAIAQGAVKAFGFLLKALGFVARAILNVETGPLQIFLKSLAALGFGPAKKALASLQSGIKTVGTFFDDAQKKVDKYADSLDSLKKTTVLGPHKPIAIKSAIIPDTGFNLNSYTGADSKGSGGTGKSGSGGSSTKSTTIVQNVVVYASNTNDISTKLAKAAKNGLPIGGSATNNSSPSSSPTSPTTLTPAPSSSTESTSPSSRNWTASAAKLAKLDRM